MLIWCSSLLIEQCNNSTFSTYAPPPEPPIEKKVKKEKGVVTDRKPRISNSNTAPPSSVAATASPLKRKPSESSLVNAKKAKADVKPTISIKKVETSSSSSSSSSDSSSDEEKPVAKKPRPIVPNPAQVKAEKLVELPKAGPSRPITNGSAPTKSINNMPNRPAPTGPAQSRPLIPLPARPKPPPPAHVDQKSLAFIKKKKVGEFRILSGPPANSRNVPFLMINIVLPATAFRQVRLVSN